MAKYNAEQAAAFNAQRGEGSNLPKTHFMGEYLKRDGDFAVVRFPYATMNDLVFETVHKVMGVFPNNIYGKFVPCTGDDNCPLCHHADENTRKTVLKFYAKMIVYTVENGKVVLNPTVWERPSMFGDSDLKNLMTSYGDLTNFLFKITRSGSGTQTRYSILPILNKAVYPDELYVKDFTSIKDLDPVKILTKSVAQYNEALNPSAAKTETVAPAVAPEVSNPVVTTVSVTPAIVNTASVNTNPVGTVTVTGNVNTGNVNTVTNPTAPVNPTPSVNGTGRYRF